MLKYFCIWSGFLRKYSYRCILPVIDTSESNSAWSVTLQSFYDTTESELLLSCKIMFFLFFKIFLKNHNGLNFISLFVQNCGKALGRDSKPVFLYTRDIFISLSLSLSLFLSHSINSFPSLSVPSKEADRKQIAVYQSVSSVPTFCQSSAALIRCTPACLKFQAFTYSRTLQNFVLLNFEARFIF